MSASYVSQYEQLWRRFIGELGGFHRNLAASVPVSSGHELHDAVLQLCFVPYREIHELVREPPVEGSSENIGATTGLFFEQTVVSLVVPFLRRLGEFQFERNMTTRGDIRDSVARDPDLCVSRGERSVVFEMKVAPKKGDLQYVLEMRQKYQTFDVPYYFVGGYTSASPSVLEPFLDGSWACLLDLSKRNTDAIARLPFLDDMLREAASFLLKS